MAHIAEIASNLQRLLIADPAMGLQFNYFTCRKEEPLPFPTEYHLTFPQTPVQRMHVLYKREVAIREGVGR